MARERTYREPLKAAKDKYKQIIYEYAAQGLSNRTIAVKLGCTIDDFVTLLMGTPEIQMAYDAGRATFETERVEIKDQILFDPETSNGLKAKILREDLKTLEQWAPATRAVRVTVEDAKTEYSFESFSQEEIEKIAQESAAADERVDGSEDQE